MPVESRVERTTSNSNRSARPVPQPDVSTQNRGHSYSMLSLSFFLFARFVWLARLVETSATGAIRHQVIVGRGQHTTFMHQHRQVGRNASGSLGMAILTRCSAPAQWFTFHIEKSILVWKNVQVYSCKYCHSPLTLWGVVTSSLHHSAAQHGIH